MIPFTYTLYLYRLACKTLETFSHNKAEILNDVTMFKSENLFWDFLLRHKANYTLRNGTERNGTLGVHDRVEIKLLLPIKKAFLKISSFSHIM